MFNPLKYLRVFVIIGWLIYIAFPMLCLQAAGSTVDAGVYPEVCPVPGVHESACVCGRGRNRRDPVWGPGTEHSSRCL